MYLILDLQNFINFTSDCLRQNQMLVHKDRSVYN